MVNLLRLKTDLRTLPLEARRALQFTASDLAAGYRDQCAKAPARSHGYFSKMRTGVTSSGSKSNRGEDHLAVGLFNRKHIALPDGSHLKLLDYQFPLKAVQADAGVGKVDLLGTREDGTLTIVELKVERNTEDRRIALVEGLIYAAIVEANLRKIADEALAAFDDTVMLARPHIILLGSPAYWSNPKPFPSVEDLRTLARETAAQIGTDIALMNLHDVTLAEYGLQGRPPQITGTCTLSAV